MTKDDLKSLNLSEEIEDLPNMLMQLNDFVLEYHQPVFERQANAMKFKQGDQWRYMRPPGFAMLVNNKIGSYVDIIAANLTEGEWIWQVSPCHAGVDDMVKIWNSLLEKTAEQNCITTRNFGLVEQSCTKGYGIVKLSYDPERPIPVHYEVLTPYEYMGEPGVRRPDIDGSLHIHTAIKTAREVRAIWPDDWDKIKYCSMNDLDDPSKYEVMYERGGKKDSTHVTQIREFWIRDDSEEPIPDKDTKAQIEHEHNMFNAGKQDNPQLAEDHTAHMEKHNAYIEEVRAEIEQQVAQIDAEMQQLQEQGGMAGGQMGGQMQGGQPGQMQGAQPPDIDQMVNADPRVATARVHIKRHEGLIKDNPDGTQSKYNGWRHIIAGGPDYYILHNGQTPYKDSLGRGITHFYALPCIDSAADYFQLSIVEKSYEPQENINLAYSKIHDHLTHVATGVAIDVTKIAVPLNQIKAAPGGIFPVRGDPRTVISSVSRESIDPATLVMLSESKVELELVTGVSEVHLGGYPRMERASEPMISRIAHLTEARWRAYHRQYADFLKRTGKGVIQIIQQFMTEQRQVRVAQGLKYEYTIVNKSITSPDGKVTFANELSVGEFDVQVQLKPLSAMNDEAKIDLAIRLYTLGTPQGGTILDDIGFAEMVPDPAIREATLRQIETRKAAQERQQEIMKAYLADEIDDNKMAVLMGQPPNTRSSGGRIRPNPKAKAGYGEQK